ncbi:hypothetical protein ACQ4PT_006600 [Festuca glaucescens]
MPELRFLVQATLVALLSSPHRSTTSHSLSLSSSSTTSIERELHRQLRYLDFSCNNFYGAEIPEFIGYLPSLRYLNLSYNRFYGRIPPQIGNLSKLTYLDLKPFGSNNPQFYYLYPGDLQWLSHLSSLKHLDLNHMNLTAVLDWVHEINMLPALRKLYLQYTGLRNRVDFLGQSNLTALETSLQLLHISNASITEIPDWFWVAFSRAEFVDLSDNQIASTLPAILEFMAADTMVLFNNRYTGMVPKFPRNITYMDLSRNSFSGTLPSDFGAPLLQALILYNNSISGTIPSSICPLSKLFVLDLSGNKLTGEVPSCEEDYNQQMHSLQVVNLNTNNLSGEFPRVLRSSMYLAFIDLSYIKFSGDLPVWVGAKQPYLALLRLRHNMFSGQIPVEIGMIQELQFLDLAHNNFSGIMPDSLVNMNAMARISGYSDVLDQVVISRQGPHLYNSVYDLINFVEQVSVLTKGQQLEFSLQIPYMVILDLSCNSITGVIPQGIGALIGLRGLNFSWNSLSGEIPKNIGELKQLESLDLSNNELSGEIPSSMTAITSLSHINLSYNTLSGKIPFGNQLGTFDASSYIGNIGLCGFPLTNSCPAGNGLNPPAHADDGDGLEDISLYLGFVVGFVLGLWVIFCGMLFKRKWRISYFLFVEGLQDKIYVTAVLGWANLKSKLVKT